MAARHCLEAQRPHKSVGVSHLTTKQPPAITAGPATPTCLPEERHQGTHQMQNLTRRAFAAGATIILAAPAILRFARAAEPLQLRCSLDTAPTHGRNVAIGDYLQKLEKASNGAIQTKVFPSGQLFADLNVAKALIEGQVDMACPGHWVLTGIVPDCDFFQLPVFYGQDISVTHRRHRRQAPAPTSSARSKPSCASHVLGHGSISVSRTGTPRKTDEHLDDVKGMKIRSPGGAGISPGASSFSGGIPEHHRLAERAAGAVAGHLRRFRLAPTKALVGEAVGGRRQITPTQDHQFIGRIHPDGQRRRSGRSYRPISRRLMTDLWAQNIGDLSRQHAAAPDRARKTMEEQRRRVHRSVAGRARRRAQAR